MKRPGKLRIVQVGILIYLGVAVYTNRDLLERAITPARTLPTPATEASPAGAPAARVAAFAPAPLSAALLAGMKLPPPGTSIQLWPDPAPAERLKQEEEHLFKTGCKSRAFVHLRALGRMPNPYTDIQDALVEARQAQQWAEVRRLLEEALARVLPDDLATRLLILSELVEVCRDLEEDAQARARASEAALVAEAVADIAVDEMQQHPDWLAFSRQQGRDPVVELKKAKARYRETFAALAEPRKKPDAQEAKRRLQEAEKHIGGVPWLLELYRGAQKGERVTRADVERAVQKLKGRGP